MEWIGWIDVLKTILSAAVGALVGIASHRITARFSSELWVAQERWKLKGQLYREVLSQLHKMTTMAQRLVELADATAEGTPAPAGTREIALKLVEYGDSVHESSDLCELWLSKSSIDAIHQMFTAVATIDDPAITSVESARRIKQAIMRAQFEVLQEAKRDLAWAPPA